MRSNKNSSHKKGYHYNFEIVLEQNKFIFDLIEFAPMFASHYEIFPHFVIGDPINNLVPE